MRLRTIFISGLVGFCLGSATVFLVLRVQASAIDPHAEHAAMAAMMPAGSAQAAASTALPPGADDAKVRLEKSPRHGEWVDVKRGQDPPIKTWVVYPERKDKAPVVIVIHEIFGLTDWIRGVADQLAAEGFIAVAA